jgi:hypothetical protein
MWPVQTGCRPAAPFDRRLQTSGIKPGMAIARYPEPDEIDE